MQKKKHEKTRCMYHRQSNSQTYTSVFSENQKCIEKIVHEEKGPKNDAFEISEFFPHFSENFQIYTRVEKNTRVRIQAHHTALRPHSPQGTRNFAAPRTPKS